MSEENLFVKIFDAGQRAEVPTVDILTVLKECETKGTTESLRADTGEEFSEQVITPNNLDQFLKFTVNGWHNEHQSLEKKEDRKFLYSLGQILRQYSRKTDRAERLSLNEKERDIVSWGTSLLEDWMYEGGPVELPKNETDHVDPNVVLANTTFFVNQLAKVVEENKGVKGFNRKKARAFVEEVAEQAKNYFGFVLESDFEAKKAQVAEATNIILILKQKESEPEMIRSVERRRDSLMRNLERLSGLMERKDVYLAGLQNSTNQMLEMLSTNDARKYNSGGLYMLKNILIGVGIIHGTEDESGAVAIPRLEERFFTQDKMGMEVFAFVDSSTAGGYDQVHYYPEYVPWSLFAAHYLYRKQQSGQELKA